MEQVGIIPLRSILRSETTAKAGLCLPVCRVDLISDLLHIKVKRVPVLLVYCWGMLVDSSLRRVNEVLRWLFLLHRGALLTVQCPSPGITCTSARILAPFLPALVLTSTAHSALWTSGCAATVIASKKRRHPFCYRILIMVPLCTSFGTARTRTP